MDRNVSGVVEVGKGLEVTVKEQQEQGRVRHEKGKGESERGYAHCNLELEPCMCVTRIRMCEVYAQCMNARKMCVYIYHPLRSPTYLKNYRDLKQRREAIRDNSEHGERQAFARQERRCVHTQ